MSWLRTETVDGARWLTIDRPDRENAIPADGFRLLTDALEDFESGDDRVLVIIGAGGRFCSGADIGPDDGATAVSEGHRHMKVVERAAIALHRTTKPTIAAVDGVAAGSGMNLALGCDVVVASDRASFSETQVRHGLTVDFGGTWLLPRIVGLQRAKELALTGRVVDAEEALRLGIVMEVVPAGSLRERAAALARSFLEGSPIGQMFAKQALNASFESSFAESVSWEGQSQSIVFGTDERDPRWKGS